MSLVFEKLDSGRYEAPSYDRATYYAVLAEPNGTWMIAIRELVSTRGGSAQWATMTAHYGYRTADEAMRRCDFIHDVARESARAAHCTGSWMGGLPCSLLRGATATPDSAGIKFTFVESDDLRALSYDSRRMYRVFKTPQQIDTWNAAWYRSAATQLTDDLYHGNPPIDVVGQLNYLPTRAAALAICCDWHVAYCAAKHVELPADKLLFQHTPKYVFT